MNSKSISGEEQQEHGTVDADETQPDAETLPRDEIFHLLQNGRRRMVLEYIRGTEEPVRMREIAEQVAAWEHDTTVEQLTSDQRQRVYIPLYQSHLSKLDKAGVIEYQQNRGIVKRKPLADQLDRYLQPTPDPEQMDAQASNGGGWDDYYIGVASVGALAILGAVLELPFFSVISGIGLSALILLMFTVLTVGRYLI